MTLPFAQPLRLLASLRKSLARKILSLLKVIVLHVWCLKEGFEAPWNRCCVPDALRRGTSNTPKVLLALAMSGVINVLRHSIFPEHGSTFQAAAHDFPVSAWMFVSACVARALSSRNAIDFSFCRSQERHETDNRDCDNLLEHTAVHTFYSLIG